jgi:hypothetical protein
VADYIYDIETFPNVFTLSIKRAGSSTTPTTADTGSTERRQFEISHRRNQHGQLIQLIAYLIATKARMVGFNNIGFDYPVLHHVLNNPEVTPIEIYNLAMRIIDCDHSRRFDHIIWDRDQIVPQVDLFKIHHFDNVAKATSLKILQFNMRSAVVQDLPFPPGTVLTDEQIDILLQYNDHDVDETELFYNHSLDAIRFREELSAKYDRNFINHNDTKIGKDYFIMEMERQVPGSCYTTDVGTGKRKPRQTWRHQIALQNVIFPWIKFKRSEFTQILDYFKGQVITETKGAFDKLSCTVNGFQFDFGTGGIHGSVSSCTVVTDEHYEIIDVDVTSYYPSLAIVNRLYPEHLSDRFCDIYGDVKKQRVTYAKGTPENGMLKLALNGLFGDTNSVYSPFYDPQYTMAITINGQLLICLLADYLMDIPGLELIQVNTDGVTVRCPRCQRANFKAVCDWWQAHTLLDLEEAVYSRMFIRDVNNYIAEYIGKNGELTGGKLKRKGAYEWQTVTAGGTLGWHQNHSALVIPMAAEAALVDGISPRDFILNHDDIFDFMLRTKVPRSSRLVLVTDGAETELQNITRYYISKTGGSLVKAMPPLAKAPDKIRRIGIDVGWKVTECNDIRQAVGQDINFEYYIKEAEKLVNPVMRRR